MDKQDLTLFLKESYGRYELNDYVLSTHQCIEEKTEKDFIGNVNRMSVNKQQHPHSVHYNGDINKCIKSRFKETDIG